MIHTEYTIPFDYEKNKWQKAAFIKTIIIYREGMSQKVDKRVFLNTSRETYSVKSYTIPLSRELSLTNINSNCQCIPNVLCTKYVHQNRKNK